MSVPPLSLPSFLAFGVALTLSAAIRLIGGRERGRRMAGLSIPAGFLSGWAASRGLDLHFEGLASIIPSIVLTGSFLGLALDSLGWGRTSRITTLVLFCLVCVWITLGSPTTLPTNSVLRLETAIGTSLLFLLWIITLLRLEAYAISSHAAEGIALFVATTLGITTIAFIAQASTITSPAVSLTAAACGFAVIGWISGTPLSTSALFGGGSALLGIAQYLGRQWPGTLAPLAILLLCLFAGPTAHHLPGPEKLRPLWTFLLALLPVALACTVADALLRGY